MGEFHRQKEGADEKEGDSRYRFVLGRPGVRRSCCKRSRPLGFLLHSGDI